MGKYMKKSKITANLVLPMELPVPAAQYSSVGVCTRAKSLALQSSSASDDDASSYLELRSRRLKKVFSVSQQRHRRLQAVQKPTSPPPPKQSELVNSPARSSPFRTPPTRQNSVSVGVGPNKGEASSGNNVAEAEASTGDDNLPILTMERVARGSTNSHEAANHMSTPPTANFLRDMPSFREFEAFFAAAEREQQRKFMEKYNFDIVAEKPLPGRYEWSRISHE